MLRRIKKIDELSLFFILGLLCLFTGQYTGLFNLKDRDDFLSFNENIVFDDNITFSRDSEGNIKSVQTLHPGYRLAMSNDGGDHYTLLGKEVDFDQIRLSEKLNQIPTAVRWSAPHNPFKTLNYAHFMLVDEDKKVRSNQQAVVSVSTVKHDLPIVHLAISEQDLFSEQKGLMVLGQTSWNQPGFYESWFYREGNFSQRGIDWERLVNFQLFEGGQLKYNANGGLRISGNATRGFAQKSFRLKARKIYGNGKFKCGLFGKNGLKKYESFVIRMSGNDNTHTLFADLLMQRLAEGSNLLTQKGRPVVVYINGNYWGIYNLRERIDDYFVAKYEGVKSKKITILEGANGELKDGKEKYKKRFDELIAELKRVDVINQDQYKNILGGIDEESFMDYIFFETYYANNDWLANNCMWYSVDGSEWKWLLNDLDYSLAYPGYGNVHKNMFEELSNSITVLAVLWNRLLTNEGFVAAFKERAANNLDEFLSEDRIREVYELTKSEYSTEIENHIARWRVVGSVEKWEQNCQNNLQFLLDRRLIYLKQLEKL